MVKKVYIEYFKSIKKLELDCKKINLFIGKPNVGKSNILEALCMFQEKKEGIRHESIRNLFHNQDLSKSLLIRLDDLVLHKHYHTRRSHYVERLLKLYDPSNGKTFFEEKNLSNSITQFLHQKSNKFSSDQIIPPKIQKAIRKYDFTDKLVHSTYVSNFQVPQIKQYSFKPNIDFTSRTHSENLQLTSPHGDNLFEVLKNNRPLFNKVSSLFSKYGYNIVIDFISNETEIQKVIDNVSYRVPYSLVADTLQRITFYQAALMSNSGTTIILEEPESHSFPPYIREIALEIINSPNQFFITTHSPYLLNTIVSKANSGEVSINIVDYENFQTTVKTLSLNQATNILNHGMEFFSKLNSFIE